jgi:hypothetical protein
MVSKQLRCRAQANNWRASVDRLSGAYAWKSATGLGASRLADASYSCQNLKVFANPIFNYTQNFNYIWDEVVLLIAFDSNLDSATRTLMEIGSEYTKEYLKGAEAELEKMRQNFWVPSFELKPQVYVTVTSNWVQLTMPYVVDRKSAAAPAALYIRKFFDRCR